ncbi:NAD(P)/FAD-dependent oxidoreductase [Cyanobium sp. Alchichica 3B3-8F6]|uniref:NAD(P)/FAD-dependent oxidoreductase n=1 Tax=unclassified Cyanobium TaxID=2627006 RepID=UPI0020CBF5D1|nr:MULTISPECIES: NAD(P)/FAD-dependent oxidoreductase [unclassified Cyanobium]MCP9880930.1 NAD(P)/FAD-dependent oxidoreductase [Cyanobium sp. Alchichica 3B3-8F6]MCP9941127.1 NAD(P)/FAD-dependent oxidoreductase [Cyanobium sp. ATX 6E8]
MLVVGAGPAGAELARLLALAGVDVLLVDRLADLRQAAFSSAALPLAAVERYGLPSAVVAARWSGWQLVGPGAQGRQWSSDQPLGAVLDFGALRQWLADQAQGWGARLQLGVTALGWQPDGEGACTWVRDGRGGRRAIRSRWLVDASGESRALIGEPSSCPGDPLVAGLGVEWLLQVSSDAYAAWADRLSFFLGSDWVQQGYGWVFPMGPGQLKVGVCRLHDAQRPQPPLGQELQELLQRSGLAGAVVLDRHGGRIRSTLRRREAHRQGPLIGLGDAVSTANLLGGEGIRHALASARVLAPLLLQVWGDGGGQRGDTATPLDRYPLLLRRELGWRWSLSGRLARRTWLGLADQQADQRLERLLAGLQTKRAEDLSALLFDYRFERYGLKALPYLLGWR